MAHYCWYASYSDKKDAIKKCLPLYSQDHFTKFGWESADYKNPTYEDFKYNGQYCKSGLAFPDWNSTEEGNEYTARCTSTDHIKFNHNRTEAPYKCDPTNNLEFCQLFFNVTIYNAGKEANQSYFEYPCQCAMDGKNGYCGSVLGA